MADDLPQAGAQIVLEGVTEFMNNLQSVTSGLAKIVQGFVALSAGANTSAAGIDSATNKIIGDITKMGTAESETVDKMVAGNSAIARSANQMAADLEAAMSRGAAALSKFMFTGGGGEQLQELLGKIGSAGNGGGTAGRGSGFLNPGTEQASEAAYAKLKAAQQALTDATIKEANRRAVAEEQASKRVIDALIAEANAANKAMSEEEAALARITQEQNAASNARVEAMGREQNATTGGSLNFVRAITGMVAANNLLNIGALNTAFNIGTLAASFDRLGTKGLLIGGAIGIALAAIASLVQAFQSIVNGAEAVVSAVGQVTAQIVDFGIKTGEAALKGAADYQKAMAFYVALTGASRQELGLLNDKIVQVAQTTLFSMPKAAEAVNELARAGATGTQIITEGALDAVVALSTAAAGELGLADAAKTVTGTVGAFTKTLADGKQQSISYTEAVNAITQAAQLSRLSFTEVTQAFRQAAPVANSANISITDLAAVIAILGNASETGTLSGTALKQMILDLEHPSKKAADALNEFKVSLFEVGTEKLRPIRDVIIDMNKAFGEQAQITGKVTDQVRLKALADIFGARAALAANIITNQGVEAFDKMETAMKNVTAIDMANVMLLPLDARMTILNNSVGVLANTFAGPFVSALSDAVNAAINFIHNGLPVQAIELAGQAIVAIATNQGFGALQAKLVEMSDPKLLGFFTSLIGLGSNVRAALVDVILPAIQTVLDRMVDFASSQDTIDAWARGFDNAGTVILGVAGAISDAIGVVADFVGWLHENEAAMETVKAVAIGFATVIGTVVVTALLAAAIPMAVVTLAMGALGAMVVAVATDIQVFADAIINFVAVPAQEAAGIVTDAGEEMAAGAEAGAEGVIEAYEVIVAGSAALAEAVIGNTEVMASGVIDDTNVMVEGTAEGWDEMVSLTYDSTEAIATAASGLDPILSAVGNAPGQASTSWASGWTALLNTLHEFVTNAWNMVKGLIDAMASNPLLSSIVGGGLGGLPGVSSIVSAFSSVRTEMTGISDAAGRVHTAITRISDSVHPIIANFQNMEGKLRSSLDNIASSASRTRESLTGGGPESTTPGGYPGGGGGGGGSKGKGAGGKGPEDAYNKALDQAVEFAEDLARTIANAGADAIQKLGDVARKAAEAAMNETRDFYEKVQSIGDTFTQGVLDRAAQTTQSRADRARKKELSDTLANNTEQRRLEREDRDAQLTDIREANDRKDKLIQDNADKSFQYQQQDRATKRSQERADEDTEFKRKLDDEERRLQKLDDLHNKRGTRQTAEDIKKLQQQGGFSTDPGADQAEKARLQRARAREDLETARTRARAEEDTQFTRDEAQIAENRKLGIEDIALDKRHERALQDRAQKREDARTDLDQHKADNDATQSLDDRMQDEASERANQKAKQEAILKAATAKREHEEKLKAIKDRATEEANTIIEGLDKTLRGVQDKINDKVPEILKSGGAAMQPILDDLVKNLTDQMDIVWEGAHQARLELGLGEAGAGGSVIESMGLATDNFITASVNFTQAMIDAANRIAAATGGTVLPASTGTTVPTYTTGSTTKLPTGGISTTPIATPGGPGQPDKGPAPVTADEPSSTLTGASTIVAPSASAVTVNNVTTYQVSASYADTQSPASIGLDLSALSAISRR